MCLLAAGADFGDLRNLNDAHTDSHFSATPYASLAAWEQRKGHLRRQILAAAGLAPLPERNPLHLERNATSTLGDFVVEVIAFEPLPGLRIAGNLYRPSGARGRLPAVLVPHGHWKRGRIHDDEDYSVPKLCANLARQGYVALAYDMLGYNESRQLPHSFGGSSEEQLWAFHPLGLQLWTAIRALDLLQSLPYVDARRMAVTGASGGGTFTMLLTAVDDRIRAAAPVVMVSAIFQGDDACEMAPGLRVRTNNMEIAAMAAPRPMLLVSSTKDWTRHTPRQEFPAVQAIYKLYGAADRTGFHHVDEKHNYNRESREAVYAFLQRHLLTARRRTAAVAETPVGVIPEKALLWPKPFTEANGFAGKDAIFAWWKEHSRQQAAKATEEALRDALRAVLGVDVSIPVGALPLPDRVLLQRQGGGERIPARWFPAGGPVSMAVSKSGSDSEEMQKLVREARDSGASVLAVDPYQTGVAVANRPVPRKDYYVFHHSDDAYRVQDIVTALQFVGTDAWLLCEKGATAWCVAASAVAPPPVRLNLAGQPLEVNLKERLFVPGIERAGGWAALRRLARSQ